MGHGVARDVIIIDGRTVRAKLHFVDFLPKFNSVDMFGQVPLDQLVEDKA